MLSDVSERVIESLVEYLEALGDAVEELAELGVCFGHTHVRDICLRHHALLLHLPGQRRRMTRQHKPTYNVHRKSVFRTHPQQPSEESVKGA
jgi:hypothetical protein